MESRFGGSAQILYHDVTQPNVIAERSEMVGYIKENGLIYPVTVIEGEPAYEGAVSYPAILRAVQSLLQERV
jgi:disulfide oxidoreductase YuzD